MYSVPLKSPDWPTLADYAKARTAHFAALSKGEDALWDRTDNTVTYTSTSDETRFFTGVDGSDSAGWDDGYAGQVEQYGSDLIARVDTRGARTTTLTVRPRQ